MQGRKLQHPGCLKHRQLSFAVLPIHSKLFACPLRWVEIGSTLHSYSPFSTHLLRWAALRNCTNSAHAHIPVAVLGLLDLPDPCQGLPPPTNFKFLARAQKGSGNETNCERAQRECSCACLQNFIDAYLELRRTLRYVTKRSQFARSQLYSTQLYFFILFRFKLVVCFSMNRWGKE